MSLAESSTFTSSDVGLISNEPQEHDLDKLIEMVNLTDKTAQIEGVTGIRKLLSREIDPPIQQVVDSGVTQKLLEFMSWHNELAFQLESSWAITNICSGTTENVEFVVNLGGLDIIINLLRSPAQEIVDQNIWSIGNIAGDNPEFRDLCLNKGAMNNLINAIERFPTHYHIKKNGIWAVSNLIRAKPVPKWDKISLGMKIIKEAVSESDLSDNLVDALWAISNVCDRYIQEIIELGFIPDLLRHLEDKRVSVVFPTLRALGNIVTGDEFQTNAVISHTSFIARLFDLMNHKKKAIRREVCWIISNITAGNSQQISTILDYPNFIETLCKKLSSDHPEVGAEVAWVISNLCSGATTEQKKSFV